MEIYGCESFRFSSPFAQSLIDVLDRTSYETDHSRYRSGLCSSFISDSWGAESHYNHDNGIRVIAIILVAFGCSSPVKQKSAEYDLIVCAY
jgi:hypothetical protein